MTPTPHFEAALQDHWSRVRGATFTCKETGTFWTLTEGEKDLYHALHLPIPTLGPIARLRRLAASVGGFDLFRRGKEQHVSMYDPESPAQLITNAEWHGNTFDPLAYGQQYDPRRSFFEQWHELSLRVPRSYLIQDPESENSPWGIYDLFVKNSYFTYANLECEQALYSDISVQCKHIVDCTSCVRCEVCYETVQCFDSSHLSFCERCEGCLNLWFCLGCRNCHDCFGCTNLRGKSFCWLNEQLTEQEYRERLAQADLRDHRALEQWQERIQPLWGEAVRSAGRNYQSEESFGDDLASCKQVKGISILEGQRLYNVFAGARSTDCVDLLPCNSLERSASCIYSGNGYENHACSLSWECVDVAYSELLTACEHCFGCIGLRHKQFCILNKQYSEEEYWRVVDHLKTDMLKRGEYGEYFPYTTTLFAYNTSHADAAFPLSKQEALTLGARWYDFVQESSNTILSVEELPTRLDAKQLSADTHFYRCPVSQRPFRFVQPEWDFHQEKQLALARLHPTVRRKQRFAQLQPLYLTERTCGRCQKEIFARYPLSHKGPVWCETCYEKYVMLGESETAHVSGE